MDDAIMRCKIIRVRRLPRWPVWAVATVAAWAAAMTGALYLHHLTGRGGSLCWFHRLTHLPCPTCGLTRGLLALWHGQWLEPWTLNPLLFTLLAVFGATLFVRGLTGYTIRFHASRREAGAGWAALFLAILANWAYLIYAGV